MSRRKEPLTHEEHVELAKHYRRVSLGLNHIFDTVASRYPISSKVYQQAWRQRRKLLELKSALDNEYHKVTSNAQFEQSGHVYYKDKD